MGSTTRAADRARPTTTADGRWIVIDGRRWRATDPSIPEALRIELVAALMAARRAVRTAAASDDPQAERAARGRVHRAKVALGERGAPWWEETSDGRLEQRIEAAVLTLADHRAPDRTLCPSDVARIVGARSWRPLMPSVREVVAELARQGEVEVVQKGEPIDVDGGWKGPIRIRRAPDGRREAVGDAG